MGRKSRMADISAGDSIEHMAGVGGAPDSEHSRHTRRCSSSKQAIPQKRWKTRQASSRRRACLDKHLSGADNPLLAPVRRRCAVPGSRCRRHAVSSGGVGKKKKTLDVGFRFSATLPRRCISFGHGANWYRNGKIPQFGEVDMELLLQASACHHRLAPPLSRF